MDAKILKALKNLGLTEYEAKSYLTLVSHGTLSASQVSELAGVPYSKIYSVLENLARRGWIEVGSERPKTYSPRAPIEILKIEKVKRLRELDELEKFIQKELQPIYEKKKPKEKPNIWIIRGVDGTSAKIRDVVENAKVELLIAAPKTMEKLVFQFKETLLKLLDSGVKIKILVESRLDAEIPNRVELEVRSRNGMFGGGVIADGREAILILGGFTGSPISIWSDHVGLAQIAKIYFEHLWSSAKPIAFQA